MSILLPFSSYGPDAAAVSITLPISVGLVPSSGFIEANAGFLYGNRSLVDSTLNPPIYLGGGTLLVRCAGFSSLFASLLDRRY